MANKNKVKSVLELGRYKVGDIAYWVVLRSKGIPEELNQDDYWMEEYHAKIKVERGPLKKLWRKGIGLPKLHHIDFNCIVSLLTHTFVVEEFTISDIHRSTNTGEYFYANEDKEWMPEEFLFDSVVAARREKTRIMKIMSNWAK